MILEKIYIVFLAFILCTNSAISNEISFKSYDMTSGLSNNSALCIIQDHNGFVWIGTRDGLNKYDGVDFKVYKHLFNDGTSISNNQINCIAEASNQEIWVGTADGLNKYDYNFDAFSRIDLHPGRNQSEPQYIWSILESSDQKIWVGTGNGLYRIDQKSDHIEHYLIHQDLFNNANIVIYIFEDSKNRIWFGTRNGLYLYTDDRFKRCFLDRSLEANEDRFQIRDIQESNDGLFWAGTENYGIFSFTVQDTTIQLQKWTNSLNSNLISNTVRKIFFNTEREVWIGTLEGLCIYNRNSDDYQSFTYSADNPYGISNNSVRDILKDNQGGLWIASYSGGINYFHPQNNLFTRKSWLDSPEGTVKVKVVTVLFEDENENLWIGTEGDGLFQYDKSKKRIANYFSTSNSGLTSNNIKAIASDNTGNIWIGTFNGLSCLNPKNKTVKNFSNRKDDKNSLNNNQVHALYFENKRELWIGSNGGGVQIYDSVDGKFRTVKGLEEKNVNSLFKDSRHRVWVGTQSGVFAISDTSHARIDLDSILGNHKEHIDYINFVTEDSSNNIWIGTQWNGLFLVKEGRTYWFTSGNGLNDNTVNALLEGENNQLWVTTNKGLSRLNYSESPDGVPNMESKTFTIRQGVQGMQFYPRSALKLNSGDLLFGGVNGYNQFNPENITDYDYYPPVILTQFRLKYKQTTPRDEDSPLTKSINEISRLKLKFGQRDFSVFFTGINFIDPDNTYYRYMVKDLDESWIDLGKQRFINFTYFPEGTHELRIKASTSPDKWDESFRSLEITVLPPWWKTRWAFMGYIVILIVLLLVFFIVSQKWAGIKNQLEMEYFQREKEKELHRLKLKFFTDVSHELRTPLTLILAPLENLILQAGLPSRLRNQLIQIQRSGYRMMQLVNQVLDLRKLETGHERLNVAEGNIIRFFKEISLAFKEIAQAKNTEFEFFPHKNELILWYDRDKLEIIMNNLLSNAFKFTYSKGKVRLATDEVKGSQMENKIAGINNQMNYLEISVINDGEVIAPEDLEQIYERFYSQKKLKDISNPNVGVGLELTKRMVELHKGGISVKSFQPENRKGGQTTFSVYLPIGKEVYSDDEIDHEFKTSEDPSLYSNEFLKRETINADEDDRIEITDLSETTDLGKILIVEDNSEVRRFIKELFSKKYEVYEAENGKVGFEKAVDVSPDLIISDVMMPVMDGIELCKKIKTDVRTSHIPVILLTARTAVTFKYEGLETGADDYITKPFSAKYLLLRVENLIKQRNLLREHFKRETICDPGSITVTSVDEKLLKKAVDYITENIENPAINVNILSEYLGLSRVHFYRKIKAITNQTAVEFIRSIRLKRAASLLSQQKLSVKEVQNMVGFDDSDYFRKCFKEQFGVNPSEYIGDNPQ